MAELTEAELDARRAGLGGSDMAGVFRLGFSTPFMVWASKVWGHRSDVTAMMQRGHDLEALIADKAAERRQLGHLEQAGRIDHPDIDWLFATLDYRAAPQFLGAEPAPLECKAIEHRFKGDEWGEDDSGAAGVPQHYQIQVQQQLAVTGAEAGLVAVLFVDTWELRTYEVPRDDSALDLMIRGGQHFWEHHVVGRVPPPVTDPDKDWDALKSVPLDAEQTIDLPPSAAELVTTWRSARDDRKAAEKIEKECKTELAKLMGGAGQGLIDGEHAVTLNRYAHGSSIRQVLKDQAGWKP